MINCFYEVLIVKLPTVCMDNTLSCSNLITYLCHICRRKALGFFTERYVPLTTPIEAHHTIKTCT